MHIFIILQLQKIFLIPNQIIIYPLLQPIFISMNPMINLFRFINPFLWIFISISIFFILIIVNTFSNDIAKFNLSNLCQMIHCLFYIFYTRRFIINPRTTTFRSPKRSRYNNKCFYKS